jgi:hypothetical protein
MPASVLPPLTELMAGMVPRAAALGGGSTITLMPSWMQVNLGSPLKAGGRELCKQTQNTDPEAGAPALSVQRAQGRTTYGGCSAALCLEAAKRLLRDQRHSAGAAELPPLRSAQVAFVGPAGGDVKVLLGTCVSCWKVPQTRALFRLLSQKFPQKRSWRKRLPRTSFKNVRAMFHSNF